MMRVALVGTVLALASVSLAQGDLPACAQQCVLEFTSGSQIGNCGNLDAKCICSNASFLSNIACCLASVCDAADQASAVTYAKQICLTQGVTVPDAVSCASTSATSPATTNSASSASAPIPTTSSAAGVSGASITSSASSAPSAASTTKNAGIQNAAGSGMGFLGSIAAILALL